MPVLTSPRALPAVGGTNAWHLLKARAVSTPDRPFVIWAPFTGPVRTWTYSDLVRDAAALAAGLTHRGVRSGDRVLVHLENCPEFMISWFACAALGAVAVTTNARSTGPEIAYFAEHSGAVGCITQPGLAARVATHAPGLGWIACTAHDAGVAADVTAGEPFRDLLRDPHDLMPAAPDWEAAASVHYTSGTTARPKGVVWTQGNAVWAARVNASHQNLQPADCHLAYMPLFHTNALGISMLASLWVGSRFVLIPKWSTSRFWDISLRHGCTWLSLMPLSTRALAESEVPDGHSYRLLGTGMCDLRFAERMGAKAIGWWGMTETISQPIVGDPFTPNRRGSIGRPAAEYDVAVVGDDGRTPVAFDEPGDLLVRGLPGLSLFGGYLDQPDLTRASFDEHGWFRTGDRAVRHQDGHLSFVERAKDMLRVGSENVAAAEIERVILGVAGVREAAVVPRPDPSLDEVPVAFVIADTTSDEVCSRIISECRTRLADFKVPREIVLVRELPRATLGKVRKAELRDLAGPSSDRAAAEARWVEEAHGSDD